MELKMGEEYIMKQVQVHSIVENGKMEKEMGLDS